MFKFIILSLVLGVYSVDQHSLAIHSKSHVEVIPAESHREDHSTYVDIEGGVQPVFLTFKTQSSPVYVRQRHSGTKGSHQKSFSKDETHVMVHEVTKPVIQMLRETVEPYRKVIQLIKPVHEEVLIKVHKLDGQGGYVSPMKHRGYGKNQLLKHNKDGYGYGYDRKGSYKVDKRGNGLSLDVMESRNNEQRVHYNSIDNNNYINKYINWRTDQDYSDRVDYHGFSNDIEDFIINNINYMSGYGRLGNWYWLR